jgi:mono/diheme cytochrome c family protein
MKYVASAIVCAVLGGCSSGPMNNPPPPDMAPAWPYPQVPADPQRMGDPAKGYDYLINGSYITCGLPKSLYDAFVSPPPAADLLPARTGDDAALPYYYSAATSSEGVRVVSANCLMCHGGHINGQLVVGLGAADRDFTFDQSQEVDLAGSLISDPTEKMEWQRFDDRMHAIAPYTQTLTVGVNPADNLTASLMAHRDPQSLAWSMTPMLDLPPPIVVPVDVPPWWRMKKKNAMFYNASGRGDHARIMMAASLLCTDTVADAQTIDAAFVDVRAWIESMSAPAYPFPVDATLAAQGQTVFEQTCSSCHGTYGDNGVYPNEVVPVDVVGTDSALALGASQFAGRFVQWFDSSFWGQVSRIEPQTGYIAPPLDGIWATAPFFHNGSVPTVEAVLDSTKRPTYWTRTYDSMDYDQAALGWNFTVLSHGQAGEPNAANRVKIYDTTQLGYGNGGHTYGDGLSDGDRKAVIEYLKTL